MLRLTQEAERHSSYPIYIGGELADSGVLEDLRLDNVAFVIDRRICHVQAGLLAELKSHLPSNIPDILVPASEKTKSLEHLNKAVRLLWSHKLDRNACLLAVGGGTITDFTGFLASIYMRGIAYVNVPTTLVGQLDAGIGGKTGLNFGETKNLIGSFHHPLAVLIDTKFLGSLPVHHVRNGLAEAVKTAIVGSEKLFNFIENNLILFLGRSVKALEELVYRTVTLKLHLLEPDPYESDHARPLNLGHTIGHVIELLPTQGLHHGDAVGIGMAVATRIGLNRGLIQGDVAERILSLLRAIGLRSSLGKLDSHRFANELRGIQAIRGGALHFVVPRAIGSVCIVDNVTIDELYAASLAIS